MPLPSGYRATEGNPLRYTRPLSDTETSFVHAIKAPRPFIREPVRIHIFAEVSFPTSSGTAVSAIRTAWKALRLLHEPDIATTFDYATMEKVYQVEDEAGLERWLQRTFSVADEDQSVEDVMHLEQSRTEMMPICRVVPRRRTTPDLETETSFNATVLLLFSHWRTEASGVYMLLNRLLRLTSGLLGHSEQSETLEQLRVYGPGEEVALLTPAPEDMACPLSAILSIDENSVKSRIRARFEAHKPRLPSLELPSINAATHPTGPVKVHRLIFSQSSTAAFVAACKAAGPELSVTSACLAAYLAAIWPLTPENRERWFASMMPAQMRTRLTAEGTEVYKQMGCWNSAQMVLLSSPPPSQTSEPNARVAFVHRARHLHSQVAIANDPDWLLEMRELSAQSADFWASIPAGSGAAPWFTSLGDLERGGLLQPTFSIQGDDSTASAGTKQIRLVEVYGWADPVGMGIVLTVWTWKGRMNWQIQWNGSYHDRAMVVEIMDGMREEVVRGLAGLQKDTMVPQEVVQNEY